MLLVRLLSLSIIFSTVFFNGLNVTIEDISIENAYAHSFTPNSYAKFVSSIDEFQVESKLAYDNLIMDNSSLSEKHASEAISIFSWDLLSEAEERDKRVSDEIKSAIESLQNISLSVSKSPSIVKLDPSEKEQMVAASQLMKVIDANSNIMINKTELQQQTEDSNPLNQVTVFFTNIFNGQKDSNNTTIHPMRFVEVADSVLRNYGDAYDVNFDMTDMAYMTNMHQGPLMNNSRDLAENSQNKVNSIENAANYQTALGLSEKLLEIFDMELKPIMHNNGAAALATNLEDGIVQLTNSIKGNAAPEDIMMIVHTQIHPNLIKAFNLQILSEL